MAQPAIIGIAAETLSDEEATLLRRHPPAGVILFARNIAEPAQLSALIASLRATVPGALLMVDQEGGRVARLRAPHWQTHPPARAIGALHVHDPRAGLRVAWITGALIGAQCRLAGFDVAAAPVLDVADPSGHDVIGDRAYAADPNAVAALGDACARGILAAGVQPVGKHAPGHGRASADSHKELPVLDGISEADLIPFRRNAWLPWMMTAHIRYKAQDMDRPATISPVLTGLIRGLGFGGVLTTDDLAMQALSGSAGERASRAIEAGCDIALHCAGVLAETADVLASLSPMAPPARDRLRAGSAMAKSARVALDIPALTAERAALLPC